MLLYSFAKQSYFFLPAPEVFRESIFPLTIKLLMNNFDRNDSKRRRISKYFRSSECLKNAAAISQLLSQKKYEIVKFYKNVL